MTHPLGPRYVRPSQRAKKITLKPPTDTYLIHVCIPTHIAEEEEVVNDRQSYGSATYESSLLGSSRRESLSIANAGGVSPAGSAFAFASAAHSQRVLGADYSNAYANVIPVYLHVSDTVSTAVRKVLAQYAAAHNNERELVRPPEAYMLCRCFADFTVDFSQRGLHGDSAIPLQRVLEFPYYLSLQVIPYQQRRDVLELEVEPQRRQALREERRIFVLFALEYAAMLRRQHQQYTFLLGRDADARRSKKQQEIQARHDVALRIVLARERQERSDLHIDEARAWETTAFVASATLEHENLLEGMFQHAARELGAAHRRVLAGLSACARLSQLTARFRQMIDVGLADLVQRSLAQRRALYTESRVACGVKISQDEHLDFEIVEKARVSEGIARHPDWYRMPDVTNPLTLRGDVFTSSRSLS